jgi:hypothetical protein
MQGLLANVIVLVGMLGLSIGVWAATTRPSRLQITNACLWAVSGIGATIVLFVAATVAHDQVFTMAMLVLLSFAVFFIGRHLNQV